MPDINEPGATPGTPHVRRGPPAKQIIDAPWTNVGTGPRGSNVTEVQGQTAVRKFQALGVRVDPSCRLMSAVRLIHELNARPGPLGPSDSAEYRRQVQQASRTIEEMYLIAKAAHFRPGVVPVFPPELLKVMLAGRADERDDSASSHGRNLQFQLYVAALLALMNFTVRSAEPDIVVGFERSEFGIAAKRVRSLSKRRTLIRAGADQLRHNGLRGFVAVNVDTALDGLEPGLGVEAIGHDFDRKGLGARESTDWLEDYPEVVGILGFGHIGQWTVDNGKAHNHSDYAIRLHAIQRDPTEHEVVLRFLRAIERQIGGVW
jgi:hypothetical protein